MNNERMPANVGSNDGLGPCAEARPPFEPVTLADVLDALNVFNRPKPSEDDGPWEAVHFIRVDYLPAFINIIASAWFAPVPPHADYPCRRDGRCQYAIVSGAEGLGHCPRGKCVMADRA